MIQQHLAKKFTTLIYSWDWVGKARRKWKFSINNNLQSLKKIRTCEYQGVRNVRFSENLACFVFLKHPLWDSRFCLITNELWLKILAGMSSRTYSIITPPFLSRSNLNGGWKPSIKNETSRKVSSNFDSDNIKIAIYPLICSQGKLNLFLKESIFRYPNINLLILVTRVSSRVLTVFEITVVEERHFPFQYKNTNSLMG